jgi:hypothetical protein
MGERIPSAGMYYVLSESQGKYFCKVLKEVDNSIVWKTGFFETPRRAILAAKKSIDDSFKDTDLLPVLNEQD